MNKRLTLSAAGPSIVEMSTPARPTHKFSTVDEMIADADYLRGGAYEKSGNWDLPTILDHLAKSIGNAFVPGKKNLPWPIGTIARFAIHRFAQREFYPHLKFPMPKPFRPDMNGDVSTAYAAFVAAANQLKSASGGTINVSPVGNVAVADFRKLQLLHAAHHLGFLTRKD